MNPSQVAIQLKEAQEEIQRLRNALERSRIKSLNDFIDGRMEREHDKWRVSIIHSPWHYPSYSREKYLELITHQRKTESVIAMYTLYATIERLLEKVSDESFEDIKKQLPS